MRAAGGVLHVPRPSRVSAYFAARLGRPVLDPEDVAEVLSRYGFSATAVARNLRLSRRSRNIVVDTDARKKVVKLYRPQWTPETVRYGHSILNAVHESGFPTAPLARSKDGEDWTAIGPKLFAVFDFLPGKNYSLTYLLRNDRLRLTATAGRTLAQLHRRLEGFVPAGRHHLGFDGYEGPRRRDVAWHERKLDELARKSEGLGGEELALASALMQRAPDLLIEIGRLDADLASADFPRLIIHGDYGLHNLLFETADRAVPIDYELSRLDWRLNDLISVLGKHRYVGGAYDLESMQTLLRAYGKEFPLTRDEQTLLPIAWRLYKLQAAVQYWNSYFDTNGPARKLESALDSIAQAEWVEAHPEVIADLSHAASGLGQPMHQGPSSNGGAAAKRLRAASERVRPAAGPVVMQVTPDLDIGGVQEVARTLAKYLPRAGCPTVIATFKDGPLRDELEKRGVVVERLPARRHRVFALPLFVGEMLARRRDLRRIIERHRIDVIQTQGLGTLDFLVMSLAWDRRVQVWWTIVNTRFILRADLARVTRLLRAKRRAHRMLYRFGAGVVHGVIAVSDETERAFRNEVGFDGNIDVVPNAVDVELYPAPIDRDEMRAGLGFGRDDHVMTMVGTFKEQKGHLFLIPAVAALAERHPRLHLVLAGDGELRGKITEQTRERGVQDRVHFLGSRRDVPEILAASDSFVLPSLWEGLPVALVEAMASGLPVVATAVSGTSQVMVDGATGWLVPPGDSLALAEAIEELLADPERAARMGAAARRRAEAEYSAQAQAEHLASLFRKTESARTGN